MGIKAMRRSVVIDQSGRILAVGPHPDDVEPSEPNGPVYLGYIPQQGQQVHTVEFPEVKTMDEVHRILSTHRVHVTDGKAQLAKIDD